MGRIPAALVRLVALLGCMSFVFGQTKERFPLLAYDYVDSKATLEAMRDCGITSVAFARAPMLDACQEYGIKAVLFDEAIAGSAWDKPFDGEQASRALTAIIKETGRHPAILGYHLKDEPQAGEYPELAKAVATVRKLAPGKWPYINLFPDSGRGDYEEYVDQFAAIVKPTAISYDRYVLVGEDEFDPSFWSNLAHIRKAALKYGLPFWNIILTSTHWNYRAITQADLRLQIWGSLAYGVSGIGYYKFCSREVPILKAADLGNFRDGPLDQFGEKTQSWYWLRNLNRQVHNLAPVLLRLHTDAVYHIGSIPRQNVGPSEASLIKDVPGGEFAVGEFTHQDGTRYVMIVNKSLKRSARCAPEFNVKPKSVNVVSAITGQVNPITNFYWLAPGQGVLLRIN